MKHNSQVRYSDQSVEMDRQTFREWEIEDGQTGASGPCPACGGKAWGPPIPVLEGANADLPSLESIPCQCHCGFKHGEEDATSCGRHWIVPGDGKLGDGR